MEWSWAWTNKADLLGVAFMVLGFKVEVAQLRGLRFRV